MQTKHLKPLSLIVSSIMLLTACSSNNSSTANNKPNDSEPNHSTMVLTKNIDVLDKDEKEKIKEISSTDTNQTDLIVNADSELASKSIGDIFYLPDESDNGVGVAAKIVDIQTNADGTKTIVTKSPKLGEVIEGYEGNTKEEDKVKPNIVGVIANPGTVVTTKNGEQKLQAGVTKIVGKRHNSETELSLNLDYALSTPKDKFKKDSNIYAIYKNYCAYPRSYQKNKGGSYKNALDFTDKICDKKLKITGDVTIKLGNIVDTLRLKRKGTELYLTEGQNQEYALKNNEWSYKLNLELLDKNWSMSENFSGLSKIYAQNLFKDYEKAELKNYFSKVAITGLNSKDKAGKIPVGGVLFNTFGTVLRVKGAKELEVANQLVSVEGGGVIIFYVVADIDGSIKLTAELAKEPEKFDVGVKYENNTLKMLSNKDKTKTDTNLSLDVEAQLQAKLGAAAEADFFLAGIRFANIGASYQGQIDGKIDGKINWNFTKKIYSGQGCAHVGYGKGWLTYGDIALGLEGAVDVGFWKDDFATGVQYGFMLPSQDDQKDPKYISPVWHYENLIGKNGEDWCLSTKPPEPEVISVEHDTSKKEQVGENWYVPTKIKVKNNIRSSIDYWEITYPIGENSNKIALLQRDDGYLYVDNAMYGDNEGNILLPYGDYSIDVIATDYTLKQGKTTYQIKLGEAPKVVKITSVETQPKQIVAGEKYKLTIVGEGFPLAQDFSIEGCENQKTLDRYDNKHFYECTAPNSADSVYSISIKSLDGTEVLLNKEINTLNISLTPNAVSIANKYKIQIIGKQLSPHEDFDVDGCINKKIINLMPDKHIYECTAPVQAGTYPITIKSMDGNVDLAVRNLQVTKTPVIPTVTSKLTATGITKCGDYAYDKDGNTVAGHTHSNDLDCSLNYDAEGDPIPAGQDGHIQAGQKMSYTLLKRNGEECIKDNVTGLIWEQKTDDDGLRDKDNTYTWYNPDPKTNGGDAGKQNGGTCKGSACDTQAYIQALNNANYCGYSDWRMPTRHELVSIVDYSKYNPAINPVFKNTQSDWYWSASPAADYINGAWNVNFNNGFASYNVKYYSRYVRAVRASQ